MLSTRTKSLALGLLAMCSMLVGCSSPKMGTYNLVIRPDDSLTAGRLAPLEVDLVGVKEADASVWREYKLDAYFSGQDTLRSGARDYMKSINFGPDSAGEQRISKTDPIWKVWRGRGVTNLVILANSRDLRPGAGGEVRRKEIPLTTDRWKTDTIEIVVKRSGIDVPTRMEPLKN